MKLTIASPLRLALMIAVVGSIVMLLRPDPADPPSLMHTRAMSATHKQTIAEHVVHPQIPPWIRPAIPELEISKAVQLTTAQTPPLPPPGARHNGDPTPPLPHLPNSSSQPDLVYLGRIFNDESAQVFVASNGNPVVLGSGDVLDSSWRVETISESDVTLRNLRSGETRVILSGGNTTSNGGANGVVPVQVGERFLANQRSLESESAK
ncbi:hypothetical protein V4C53_44985 [Paraburkholderia azotifigens]|uniref:hypothetical protein n=1 Tax=Paraburkholderia azotifigens TaxID=2057004 RepID=UPI00316DE5A7